MCKVLLTKYEFRITDVYAVECVLVRHVLVRRITYRPVRFPASDQIDVISSTAALAVFVDVVVWKELLATTAQYYLSHSCDAS